MKWEEDNIKRQKETQDEKFTEQAIPAGKCVCTGIVV